jgi:hypothetical protein
VSHYGISAIHWNENLGEIDDVLLHEFVHDQKGSFAISHGKPTWCSDVLSLIYGGNTIWILVSVDSRRYKNTDLVRLNVKQGRRQYLYSCTDDGSPTSSLMELPRYRRPDDLPTVEADREAPRQMGRDP